MSFRVMEDRTGLGIVARGRMREWCVRGRVPARRFAGRRLPDPYAHLVGAERRSFENVGRARPRIPA